MCRFSYAMHLVYEHTREYNCGCKESGLPSCINKTLKNEVVVRILLQKSQKVNYIYFAHAQSILGLTPAGLPKSHPKSGK